MNAENLLRVADAIEKHEIKWLGFNMSSYVSIGRYDLSGYDCGTTACLAGWASVMEKTCTPTALRKRANRGALEEKARVFLELDFHEAYALFRRFYLNGKSITSEQAVRTLRYAAKHDVVDWKAAQKDFT